MNSTLSIQVQVIVSQARAALAQVQSQMNSLNFGRGTSSAKSFGSALGKIDLASFGSRLQWLGRQLEFNFTLPILAAAGAATKFALDNETALTRIKKVYGDGSQSAAQMTNEINALQKAFVALSDEFGVAQSDVLNIAADWAQAGVSGVALAKSVQLTLQTMILGEQTASQATTSLIAIQSQYGLSIAQLTDTIDLLNMVENQTAVSMSGLIDAFTRTAGVAASSGVSVRFLAADIAALVPAAGSAANVGNALKTIFSRLQAPTKAISETLKAMGINTQSFVFQSANGQEKLLMVAKAYEKLNDAQKNYTASVIAGRFQVNRFTTLMNELTSSNGYYAKALAATSSQTAIYNQAQKELNQVLTSNPQRLKEIWVTLQNAMADIVQPLIPLILYLAQTIQQLVTWFSNLNPAIQKFVLFGLAALAAVGPLVRYFGAFAVLIAEVSKAFALLGSAGLGVLSFFAKMLAFPIIAFFNGLSFAVQAFGGIVASVLSKLPALWAATAEAIGVVWAAGMRAIEILSLAFEAAMVLGTRLFSTTMLLLWGFLETGIETILLAGSAGAGRIWRAGLEFMETTLIAFSARMGVIWRTITLMPLVALSAMWTGIGRLFTGGIAMLARIGPALLDALTGPIGIAITAAVLLIVIFWDDIKKIFSNVVNWFENAAGGFAGAFKPLVDAVGAAHDFVVKAFNSLPQAIQNAMIAVVKTVEAAAQAVYNAFSYINPWAHHSPSLVENVQTGVAEIMKQFGQVAGVGDSFNQAYTDLQKFAVAVKAVEHASEAEHYAEIRKELAGVAKDALPYFDSLLKILYPLEAQLDGLTQKIRAQQAVVDAYKNAVDAANDKLSAQSDILDQMKSQISDFSDKVSSINGDLEVLSGTQTALRQAGAGSDILSGYDQQIDALKNQKKGIQDQMNTAQTAYDKQLALVNTLTAARDALQATYDKENASLNTLQNQYDAIKQKIDDITGAIDNFDSAAQSLQQAKDAAAKAKAGGGAGALGGAGGDFPDVTGGGKLGREMPGIPDQSSLIDDFTKNLSAETGKLFGKFNFITPIKKALDAAGSWLKKNVGPMFAPIGSLFSAAFSNLPNPFTKIGKMFSGFIGPIEDFWRGFVGFLKATWKLIEPDLAVIGGIIADKFGKAWHDLAPEIAKFKDLWPGIVKSFQIAMPIIKTIAAVIGGILVLALKIVTDVLKNVLGPAFDLIIDIIKAVIKIIHGVADVIIGIFTGNLGQIVKGFGLIFTGTFQAIASIVVNTVEIVWGAIAGLVQAIWDFFKWLWNELVGHSIIPDIVNGIIYWFKLLGTVVADIWKVLWAAIKTVYNNVILPVVHGIQNVIAALRDTISTRVAQIKTIWNGITAVFKSVYDTVHGWIDKFVSAITGIPGRLKGKFSGMFDGIKDAFRSAINWLIGKWNNLSFSIPGVDTHIPGVGKIGGFTLGTPNIPLLARGGMVVDKATAIVGEGRKGFPEFVIPTDPAFRDRALGLFQILGESIGVFNNSGSNDILRVLGDQTSKSKMSFFASGGIIGGGSNSFRASGNGIAVYAPSKKEIHFHGDLSFPNVKNGDDAEEFIKNLEAMIGA